MKEYNIIIDSRLYKVELVQHDEDTSFLVRIDDKTCEVELLSEVTQKAPFSVKMRKKVYSVELPNVNRTEPFPISVNDATFRAEIRRPHRKVTPMILPFSSPIVAAKPASKTIREGAVVAPMAGKIISVSVTKGDSVKIGTVVCVLEAMKMENEITATKTGSVQEIRVSKGMAVNEGDVLVVIK